MLMNSGAPEKLPPKEVFLRRPFLLPVIWQEKVTFKTFCRSFCFALRKLGFAKTFSEALVALYTINLRVFIVSDSAKK